MPAEDQAILVYTTCPSHAEAKRIGAVLVKQKLAACVNIFPSMTAIYEWQGELEEVVEAAMLIKTRADLESAVLDAVKHLHPHETPALLVLKTGGGSTEFIRWIVENTAAPVEAVE